MEPTELDMTAQSSAIMPSASTFGSADAYQETNTKNREVIKETSYKVGKSCRQAAGWRALRLQQESLLNSLLAIIVLSPPMLIAGLLVLITSRGPMISASKRVV